MNGGGSIDDELSLLAVVALADAVVVDTIL